MSKIWRRDVLSTGLVKWSLAQQYLGKLHFVGDGSKIPTPKELSELYTSIQESDEDYYSILLDLTDKGIVTRKLDKTFQGVDLPSGSYTHITTFDDEYLVETKFRKDQYVDQATLTKEIVGDIRQFIDKRDVYKELNILHKRGLLLFGPPGSGKSSLIRNIINNEIKEDAIIITFNELLSNTFIKAFKENLNHRLKIFIFEELTSMLDSPSAMQNFLTFLDGEDSLDNLIVIATTNYPEMLPGNIVDRPSRFDRLYRIDEVPAQVRAEILSHILKRPITDSELSLTGKLSAAAIKEAGLLVRLHDIDLEEAVSMLKSHSETVKKSFKKSSDRMGF